MRPDARAAILAAGSELLGDKVDRNGPEIARRLKARGIAVDRIALLPDDRELLAEEVRRALAPRRLLVVSGGLGPTEDDLTREAVTDVTRLGLTEDAAARARIEELFSRRGRAAPDHSLRQALVLEGSQPIANVTGFAAGCVLAWQGAVLVLLPGPPGELNAMLDDALDRACALLRESGATFGARRLRRTLLLCGIGEGDAAAAVAPLPELHGLDVAWLAHPGEVRLVLDVPESDAVRLGDAVRAVRATLGRDVVSDDGRGLAEVVLRTLIEREETIALAESCTGGLLAAELTSVPGSSAAFRAGFVTYANDAKSEALGVPESLIATHGAVSAEVAAAMALGARRAGRADWGVGITGIAGPGGGTDSKPVGLVHWAVARPDGRVESWSTVFPGSRDDVRRRAAFFALDSVRRCS
jgi:nicotinamide-nucleotide amidase